METYDYSGMSKEQLLVEVYRLNVVNTSHLILLASSPEARALHNKEMAEWKKKMEEQIQRNKDSH